MDADDRQKELDALGLDETQLTEGMRFEIEPDDEDPRWEWVHIRQPVTTKRAPEHRIKLNGEDAQWRSMKYNLASAAGILAMLCSTLPLKLVHDLGIPIGTQILSGVGEAMSKLDAERKLRKAH